MSTIRAWAKPAAVSDSATPSFGWPVDSEAECDIATMFDHALYLQQFRTLTDLLAKDCRPRVRSTYFWASALRSAMASPHRRRYGLED